MFGYCACFIHLFVHFAGERATDPAPRLSIRLSRVLCLLPCSCRRSLFGMSRTSCCIAYMTIVFNICLGLSTGSNRHSDPLRPLLFPLCCLSISRMTFSLVLNWQIHADPSRSQANTLFLVHTHTGVVSLKQSGVQALRSKIGNGLGSSLGSCVLRCRTLCLGSKRISEARVQGRAR